MSKFLYFLAGAAAAVIARPYAGPVIQKGVRYTLKTFEEAQRELERQEAAAGNGAGASPGAGATVSPLHPAPAPAPLEAERRGPVSMVGSNA
jgi:hypothetical protein